MGLRAFFFLIRAFFTVSTPSGVYCIMRIISYDRPAVQAYAKKWAFSRNPEYFDFSRIGGDCTNFASQCLYAGVGVMNATPDLGWFYRSVNDRAAAWTGVEFFYRFLIENAVGDGVGTGEGPFGVQIPLSQVEIGDFLQLGNSVGDFYHTPVVVGFANGEPLVAAHTNDAFLRPLRSYSFANLRCIHILGARTI